MNASGFPQAASARIYKTFIRPVMEYGLQLTILTAKDIDVLQKTQNFAMRLIFSAQRTSSINALMKLLLLEPMKLRNQVINMKYCGRLHNSFDFNIPAVLYWRQSFTNRQLKNSLTAICKTNSLYVSANLLMFETNPLADRLCAPVASLPNIILKPILMECLANLDRNSSNVSGTLLLDRADTKHRHALCSFAFDDKKIRIPVLRWLIGCVAMHSKCKLCTSEVSRAHAVLCSGATDFLSGIYTTDYEYFVAGNIMTTFIDYLLKHMLLALSIRSVWAIGSNQMAFILNLLNVLDNLWYISGTNMTMELSSSEEPFKAEEQRR